MDGCHGGQGGHLASRAGTNAGTARPCGMAATGMMHDRESDMTAESRHRHLRIALLSLGLIFVFAVYPLTIWWPTGWAWHHGRSEYLEMIIAIYATLGVFLLLASRDPNGTSA